jgi:hypothetical protein
MTIDTKEPLWCDTCDKLWQQYLCGRWIYGCNNSGSIWDMSKETKMHMKNVGCASHSNANQESKIIKGIINEINRIESKREFGLTLDDYRNIVKKIKCDFGEIK